MEKIIEGIFEGIISKSNRSPLDVIETIALYICENAYNLDVDGDMKRIRVFDKEEFFEYCEEKHFDILSFVRESLSIGIDEDICENWDISSEVLVKLYDKYQKSHIYSIPSGVAEWMRELAGIKNSSEVAMPYGGDYDATKEYPGVRFYSNLPKIEEVSPILSELYGKAHSNIRFVSEGYNFSLDDCLDEDVSQVDAVYIPFLSVPGISSVASDELIELINQLKDGGKMVIAAPISYLQRDSLKLFRQFITMAKYLRQVLRVHATDFGVASSVDWYILVLEKSQNPEDTYLWAMPHKYSIDFNDISAHAHADEFLQEVKSGNYSTSQKISYDKITEDIAVWIYDPRNRMDILPQREGWKSVKLSSLLARIEDTSCVQRGESIRRIDFKSEGIKLYQADSTLFAEVRANGDERLLTCPALCVDSMSLRCVWVNASHECPIAIGSAAEAYRITDNLLTSDYLCCALAYPTVQEKIEKFRKNYWSVVMAPYLLLKAYIYVPDTECPEEYNRAFALAYKDAQNALLSDKERELKAAYESFAKDVHMRKHALGQTIFSLETEWAFLKKIIEDRIDCSQVVGRVVPKPISQIIDNISHRVEFASKQIDNLTVNGDFGQKESFGIIGFLQDYIDNHGSSIFQYEAVLPTSNDIMVVMRKNALRQVLDNLISNAVDHAFSAYEGPAKIKIEYMENRDSCSIIISNTGKPVAEGLRNGGLFVLGETTKLGQNGHAGIGCAQIKEIIEYDGGIVELKCNDATEYVTSFIITIPKSEDYDI